VNFFNLFGSLHEGSLNKESGGPVVYRVVPPEWTPMSELNQWPLHEGVSQMLEETNRANFIVPFRSKQPCRRVPVEPIS
jgi:hypothetical protein